MKYIYLITTLLISTIAFAQDKSSLDPLTKMDYQTTLINYGVVEKGSDGVREFSFTNAGEHPLKIYNIYSACSCDIVEQPEAPILPGEKGSIKVKYDTMKVGPIVKTITLVTNVENSTDSLILLNLRGEVVPKSTN